MQDINKEDELFINKERNQNICTSKKRFHGYYRGKNNSYKEQNVPNHVTKRRKYDVGQRLSEISIGITEFMSNHEGFVGIVKDKYSDFHVHEITQDGEITKLTNFDLPVIPDKLVNIQQLKKTLPEYIQEKMEQFLNEENNITKVEIDVTDVDKATRKNIHEISKSITNVISKTEEQQGRKILIVFKNNEKYNGSESRKDTRSNWPYQGGNYCYFVLHKVNLDTMDALNQLAQALRIKPSMFGYAGTKDRRAKTSQWISLKKGNPISIKRAAKSVRRTYVGNFQFRKVPLKLGMLYGNQFTIVLRNISASDQHIETAMTSLHNNGFLNYYGLQRFGSIASVPTYLIGKALLQGDWAEAVDLILKPRHGEQDKNLIEARKIYKETKNAKAAVEKIERSDKIEAKLLKGIAICGLTNLQGALDYIPRNTLLMYIHSYQSFVWNQVVSQRIKEFGKKPIVGDLVLANNDNENECDSLDDVFSGTDEINKNQEQQNQEVNTAINEKEYEKGLNTNSGTEEKHLNKQSVVKVLTEENVSNYTLSDIVIPLPGWKIIYPTYAKLWFEEYLSKDGLDINLKQKNRKYTLGGVYRKIVQIPSNLSWRTIRYNNRDDELVLSDIDELNNVSELQDNTDGKHRALIIKMSLKSSTYATMALREILKCDTSPQSQAAQSAAYVDEHEVSM